MKFVSAVFTTLSITLAVSGVPLKLVQRDVDPALVPEFGLQAGLNPTGTGDCDGTTNDAGQVVKIPCDSTDDKLTRIQAALVTLQNLNGPGVGCPAASTTFLAQQKAIQDGTDAPAPAPAPAPAAAQVAAPAALTAPASGGVDPALVPDFGHQAGLNPTGTGDCDGITNDAGQVVKVPCSCPPDRNSFIQALSQNVAAGHAVNNPSVPVSFPTDNSNASKAARIQAALVTLQNLKGPGVGCPAASTTFLVSLQYPYGSVKVIEDLLAYCILRDLGSVEGCPELRVSVLYCRAMSAVTTW
ncbi:hypothetical protein AN958_02099 [Leucoagaricus sp. SymC.cos]|nr:hypothetical protein AN958_02099 [Leucoagaricus sp. SymC.cos]